MDQASSTKVLCEACGGPANRRAVTKGSPTRARKAAKALGAKQAEYVLVDKDFHLEAAGHLPPVSCNLLIEVVPGVLFKAYREAFTERKGNQLDFTLSCGKVITGRYRWTYP